MQDVGYAALQIIPSFKDLDRHLEQGTSGALTRAGTIGGGRFGDAAGKSAGHRFSSAFSRIARAGVVGLLGGTAILGAAAFKLGKSSLEEAREAQKVGALTVAVIKSTGGAAKVTAKEVGDLSEALSNKTGVDDEIIQRGANMMLTFKNVRNEVGKTNDIFDQSVKITADMAAAMAGGSGGDLDLKSSSILVGKALNDPIKGLTALSRVGVTFTEGQKKQIEALVESGDRMKAQKIILGELKSEFGGAAEAQATLADKTKVAWGNIEERLGKVILPLVNKAERAFLKKGVPALEGWVDAFEKKGIPALKDFYEKAKPVVDRALPEIADALGTVKDVTKQTLPLVLDLVEAFNDLPKWAKVGLVGGGMAARLGGKLGLGAILGGRGVGGGLLASAKPLPVFVTNPGFGSGIPGAGGGKGVPPVPLAGTAALLAIPALGGAAAAHFTPVEDRNQASSASGGYAGDGGMSLPNDTLASMRSAGEREANRWAAIAASRGGGTAWSEFFGDMEPQLRKALDGAAQAFKSANLPTELKTKIALEGVPQSRAEVRDLVKEYDLTPKQKSTLFRVLGIGEATAGLRGVKSYMDSIHDKDVFLNVHTRRTNETGGFGATGSADGSTVPKDGGRYADKYLYALAPGEEVISNRYGQADRYRSLLKQINANQHLADGGTAGGGRGGTVVVERVIEREVIPNGTRIAIGQNGELELVVDRRINRHQSMRRGQKGYGPR